MTRSRYDFLIVITVPKADAPGMKKRILATALWFYAAWYAWSILANVTGMPDVLGPFVALAVGAFVWLDPMHRIWGPRPAPAPDAIGHPAMEPDAA